MVEIGLVAAGLSVGVMSGFFGIGGGTVMVPFLLYLGFGIKEAIGMSVTQMVAGALFAALLHQRKQVYTTEHIRFFGYGGLMGAVAGGILVKVLDATLLGWLFLGIVAFTLLRLFLSSPTPSHGEVVNHPLYVMIGSCVGVFSGMLGVGGSILMTPILVSFLGFELKKAAAVGQFFVIFTSMSAFVTLWILGYIHLYYGIILAGVSLAGVWAGVTLAHRTKTANYKQALVLFYVIIFVLTAKKLLIG